MPHCRELMIVKELEELFELETWLEKKWKVLRRAGRKVQTSFVSSLRQLKFRGLRLERLLGMV